MVCTHPLILSLSRYPTRSLGSSAPAARQVSVRVAPLCQIHHIIPVLVLVFACTPHGRRRRSTPSCTGAARSRPPCGRCTPSPGPLHAGSPRRRAWGGGGRGCSRQPGPLRPPPPRGGLCGVVQRSGGCQLRGGRDGRGPALLVLPAGSRACHRRRCPPVGSAVAAGTPLGGGPPPTLTPRVAASRTRSDATRALGGGLLRFARARAPVRGPRPPPLAALGSA